MTKMTITRRLLLLGSSALTLLGSLPRSASAQGTRARVTFVLVSDIYLMSDQPARFAEVMDQLLASTSASV